MSFTADVPQNEKLSLKEGSLKPKKIDKLPPSQRKWSDNVLRVLKIPSKSSQSRILADSIAITEQMRQEKHADVKQAEELCKIVVGAGTPPWKDTKKAMAAGDAKVKLDLLSLPADKCTLEKLDPDSKGVNQAFWINRKDPTATDGLARSFLCKPATQRPGLGAIAGLPSRGEVAREALAGRAAQLLSKQTGIDIGMPETHVVSVGSDKLPPDVRPQGGGDLTCSVQEARPNVGAIKKLGPMAAAAVSSDQVAGLAIFDTITLNTDRHSGNVLVDAQNNLIPIDHGASMLEPVELKDAEDNVLYDSGLARVEKAMAGPHNALLSLPGAHAPMSGKMLKSLKTLDPDALANQMAKDRNEIASAHPEMKDTVSDHAIAASRRSAMFVKLCAANKPPLSPATMQIALGTYAKDLLQPARPDKDFTKLAKQIIARYVPQQEAIKNVCTASDGEYAELRAQAEALGWSVDRRGTGLGGGIVDPVMLVTILGRTPPVKFAKAEQISTLKLDGEEKTRAVKANQEARKKAAEANQRAIADMLAKPIDPVAAADALLKVKKSAVAKLLPLLPDALKAQNANQVRTILARPPTDQLHDLSRLLESVTINVREHQTAQFRALNDEYAINATTARLTEQAITVGEFVEAQKLLADCKNESPKKA
ncbi:MAG TPA: hypothetical protein VG328_10275 [Stellaceae bacterium]|jgi:hypothetical protein|nr:hypothetical protein [Stellaceae bacterium]